MAGAGAQGLGMEGVVQGELQGLAHPAQVGGDDAQAGLGIGRQAGLGPGGDGPAFGLPVGYRHGPGGGTFGSGQGEVAQADAPLGQGGPQAFFLGREAVETGEADGFG